MWSSAFARGRNARLACPKSDRILVWTIEYTDSARRLLRKLDKSSARRILDYMDERIAPLEDVRSMGKALRGPLGEFWRYRVGEYRIICELHDKELRVLVVRVGAGRTSTANRAPELRLTPTASPHPPPERAANGWPCASSRAPGQRTYSGNAGSR